MNKPEIQFISLIPGIEETMPVIPVSKHQYGWIKTAGERAKERNKNKSINNLNTLKCPAILQFRNKGFILRAPYDMTLKIHSDIEYSWQTPYDTRELLYGDVEKWEAPITHHETQLMYDFMSTWPKDTMKIILKLNLPWTIRISKDYDVLMTDPFYKDDDRFTVCPGVFESDMGIGVLTVPVKWHSTKGEYLIKAGTAIAQLIPIKKEQVSHQNLNIEKDKAFKRDERVTYLKVRESFERNYNKTKQFLKEIV